jgi:hypothetical protein
MNCVIVQTFSIISRSLSFDYRSCWLGDQKEGHEYGALSLMAVGQNSLPQVNRPPFFFLGIDSFCNAPVIVRLGIWIGEVNRSDVSRDDNKDGRNISAHSQSSVAKICAIQAKSIVRGPVLFPDP